MLPFARLLVALEEIRDPRRGQGRRYTLPHMLLFAVLAVLAGATSYQSIITFISLHRERLNQTFGARFRRAPALNTLRNLILALDPADLEAVFRRHARGLHEAAAGQGLRFATAAALTLAHHEVLGAPDEVGAAQMLISELDLKGVLFTADALHCQKEPSRVRPTRAAPCWFVSKPTSPAFSIA
jgi:hypothetical protein